MLDASDLLTIIACMVAKESKSPWLAAGIVSAITLAVFWPVLGADFVKWDDDLIIYDNPAIYGLSLQRVGRIFTDVDSMMRYNPLTLLSWSATYQFFGLNPFWYHLANWLLHGVSAALVFLVIKKLLLMGPAPRDEAGAERVTIAAVIGALLWSLHPLRVEPVAWCTDRTYCQATFFLLLSLICYLRANTPDGAVRHRGVYMTASVVLYMVSLLSYAIGMTFFVVLFVLDIYPLKRLGPVRQWWRTAPDRRVLAEKVPFALAAGAVALVTVSVRLASAGAWEKPAGLDKFGLLDRFMQAMYVWAYYLWRPFWPIDLSPVYTRLVRFDPLSLPFVISAALLIAVVPALILLRRRWPLGLALGACYFVLLVPVLGIFEHPHYSNDRYSLLVSVLLSILVAALLARLQVTTWLRNAALVLSVVVIAGLGMLTFRQTCVWHDSVTLFEHMIDTLGSDPYAADIHGRLGNFLVEQGRTDEGLRHFEQAIRIKPDFAKAYNDRGVAYGKLGRRREATESFRRAIEIDPNYAKAHSNLANELVAQGRYDEAVSQYRAAIQLKSDWPSPMNNLAWLIASHPDIKNRDANEAIRLATRACELTGYKDAALLDTLAGAYASAGRFTEAVDTANKAIGLAEAANQPQIKAIIQQHLSFYTQGKPYIEPAPKPQPDSNRP